MKILIIGAGPSGLMTAIELYHHGITAQIIDKRSAPTQHSKAIGIMKDTIDKLERSGIKQQILDEAIPIKQMNLHCHSKKSLSLHCSDAANQDYLMLAHPQARTELLMRNTLKSYGISVQYNTIVRQLTQCHDNVSVEFSDDLQSEYDWVIGADGIHSITREAAGISFAGVDLMTPWTIADVTTSTPLLTNEMSAWLYQNNTSDFTMMIPLSNRQIRIVSSYRDALATLPCELNIEKVVFTSKFTVSVRQAECYVRGRFALVGDAAHCHSPIGAKGMNLGIDDAVDLAQSIASGDLTHYNKRRLKIGARIIRKTELARKTICTTNRFKQVIVKACLGAINRNQWLKKQMIDSIIHL